MATIKTYNSIDELNKDQDALPQQDLDFPLPVGEHKVKLTGEIKVVPYISKTDNKQYGLYLAVCEKQGNRNVEFPFNKKKESNLIIKGKTLDILVEMGETRKKVKITTELSSDTALNAESKAKQSVEA